LSKNKIEIGVIIVNCIATAFIAFFTYSLCDSTNKLWIETRKSSELTNKMFKLAYRPYISTAKNNIKIGSDGKTIDFSFVIRNEGNVIGKIVKYEILTGNMNLTKTNNDEFVMFPKREITIDYTEAFKTEISKFGTSVVDAIKKGANLNIYIKIYYVDNLENSFTHMIGFSPVVTRKGKLVLDIVSSKEEHTQQK
jgi:hypothetical protein